MKFVKLRRSSDATKKYTVFVADEEGKERKIKFGARGMSDFTKHRDEARKMLYLKRHEKREDWKDPLTAGFWSRWLLWNRPTIAESLADTKKRFSL